MQIHEYIMAILKEIEPILLVVIPTCFAIYLKLKKKLDIEKAKQKRIDVEKNTEKFKDWEHTQSINVIKDIQATCNYYRDIGHMDLVTYLQLENGTVATSKLCNMFITCLAEDDRNSSVMKMSQFVQRVPYSRMITLVNEARAELVVHPNFQNDVEEENGVNYSELIDSIPSFKGIGSYIISPVKDCQGYLIGFCLFLYSNILNMGEEVLETNSVHLLQKFVANVEFIFMKYHEGRKELMENLHIEE